MIYIFAGATVIALGIFALFLAFIWRTVVPTNRVDIVQSSNIQRVYGKGSPDGNTYYRIPSFIPKFGVEVISHSLAIFDINLSDYEAYDVDKVPFVVDVTAFFKIDDPKITAERTIDRRELNKQLEKTLQGTVRRVLGLNKLEEIMIDRATLGDQFTKEVDEQLREWGISTVKAIEFMDIRDTAGSKVIHNIMAKEKSRIEMESRVKVADNMREAETKEIEATRQIDISRAEAEQAVGVRKAETEKQVGISNEHATQSVQEERKVTTQKLMEVEQVKNVRAAEIAKEVHVVKAEEERQVKIVNAEAERESTIRIAEGNLVSTQKNAEGILAEGTSKAESEKLMLLAPVNAQITLATEIGSNEDYQTFLIKQREVEKDEAVGKEMAVALRSADLKVISNAGNVSEGLNGLSGVFGPQGGTNLGAMLEAFIQTDAGKAVMEKFLK